MSNLTKKSEWKDVNVWLRFNNYFGRFFLNPKTKKVEVQKFEFNNFNYILTYVRNSFPKSIMLYDVQEKEEIQADTAPFPILINTSAQGFRDAFKGIWKTRAAGQLILMDPYTSVEFKAAAKLFKTVGNSYYIKINNSTNTVDRVEAEILNEPVADRIIFRNLFENKDVNVHILNFSANIVKANPLKIPPEINTIVGVTYDFRPAVGKTLAKVLTDDRCWKLLFLNDEYILRMANIVDSNDHVFAMENHGLSYQCCK